MSIDVTARPKRGRPWLCSPFPVVLGCSSLFWFVAACSESTSQNVLTCKFTEKELHVT